ncbi:MAG: sigma-70 family RNA polymerase sigma factor [Chloroflexota bacterium]
MVDDKHLIQQAQNGDRQALGALYDQYQPHIYRYFAYRLGDPLLAEDLTAELFVIMVKKLGDYKDQGRPLLAWLYTIAGNLIKMHFRSQNRVEFNPLPDEMMDQNATPDQIADSRLTQAKLMRVIPKLAEDQGRVIILKFIEGLTNREIAQLLDKSEGAIKSLQHRALHTLRGFLTEEVPREA